VKTIEWVNLFKRQGEEVRVKIECMAEMIAANGIP
jgi:hypothetical protein